MAGIGVDGGAEGGAHHPGDREGGFVAREVLGTGETGGRSLGEAEAREHGQSVGCALNVGQIDEEEFSRDIPIELTVARAHGHGLASIDGESLGDSRVILIGANRRGDDPAPVWRNRMDIENPLRRNLGAAGAIGFHTIKKIGAGFDGAKNQIAIG